MKQLFTTLWMGKKSLFITLFHCVLHTSWFPLKTFNFIPYCSFSYFPLFRLFGVLNLPHYAVLAICLVSGFSFPAGNKMSSLLMFGKPHAALPLFPFAWTHWLSQSQSPTTPSVIRAQLLYEALLETHQQLPQYKKPTDIRSYIQRKSVYMQILLALYMEINRRITHCQCLTHYNLRKHNTPIVTSVYGW